VLHYLIEKLSNQPAIFLFCRGILEGNFKTIRQIIPQRLPVGDGRRVLDVACGPGAFSDLFRPEAYSGVDLNENYIRYAQRHYRGSFARMDARQLTFPEASFDDALIFGLLHHLDDQDVRAVLSSLQRVLKPGASVLVIEDIPAESRLNLIGHLLHRVENGHFIRPAEGYRRLLAEYFHIAEEQLSRSGICDYYTASVIRPDSTDDSPAATARARASDEG
jgi:ubiquinone/menaquinone biosynthesis C-methylase UbiE